MAENIKVLLTTYSHHHSQTTQELLAVLKAHGIRVQVMDIDDLPTGITRAEAKNIQALAGSLATARVRRYELKKRPDNPWTNETRGSTEARARTASKALESYVESLVHEPHPTGQEQAADDSAAKRPAPGNKTP